MRTIWIRKQYTVSSFDALSGRGRELARIDYDADKRDYDLVLSPDGTRLAYTTGHEGLIHILSLRGQPRQEIRVKGWTRFEDMEWAADCKGLFVAHGIQEEPLSCMWICKATRTSCGRTIGANLASS